MKKILFTKGNIDLALLIFRVWIGFSLFYKHGFEKLTGFSQMAPHFPDPLHIGTYPGAILALASDGICSLLVILGLVTRIAAFVMVINLLAVFLFMHQFSFHEDHAELVYIYLGGFFTILVAGAGRYSLDNKFFK